MAHQKFVQNMRSRGATNNLQKGSGTSFGQKISKKAVIYFIFEIRGQKRRNSIFGIF